MWCLVCGALLTRKMDLWHECADKSLNQTITAITQECLNATGKPPVAGDVDAMNNWFATKLTYLVNHWPSNSLLRDFWFRELYILASYMHRFGATKIVVQKMNTMLDVEIIQQQHHLVQYALHGLYCNTKIFDGHRYSYEFTSTFARDAEFVLQQRTHVVTKHFTQFLPVQLITIILDYVPLCQCKCKLINDVSLYQDFLIGCDMVACGTHLACTCCVGVFCDSCKRGCGLCTQHCDLCHVRTCQQCKLLCIECGVIGCKKCYQKCKCGNSVCGNCLMKFNDVTQCKLCLDITCRNDRSKCSRCSQNVCFECWRTCKICDYEDRLCLECCVSCSFCEDAFCEEHSVKHNAKCTTER